MVRFLVTEQMASTVTGASREAFSFHCTICYEALNLSDRPPVVLPCGHTYVCEPCAKRLKTCMECRTPLIATIKRRLSTAQELSRSVQASDSNRNGPSTMMARSTFSSRPIGNMPIRSSAKTMMPYEVMDSFPLPIPRNQVLMSLIESVQNRCASNNESSGYESGDDDNLVRESLKIMGSSSGTYVVRDKMGLEVYDTKPLEDEKQ